MNRLLSILFLVFISLSAVDIAMAQQPAPPSQPITNIHRERHEIKREKYRELAGQLRLEIHQDRRELRHLHRAMRREVRRHRRHRMQRQLHEIRK